MKTFAALLLTPHITLAQPGEITVELMNQPASMFDVGMMRLHGHLTTWTKTQAQGSWNFYSGSKKNINVNVGYDLEDDRIRVSISVFETTVSADQAKMGCEKALEPFFVSIGKFGASFFQSRGAKSDREEFHRLRKGILEMIDLSCRVYGTGSDDLTYEKSVVWQCAADRCSAFDVED